MKLRNLAAGAAALAIGGVAPLAASPAYADDHFSEQIDLAVEATSAAGAVGEVVDVVVTVINHGPDPGNPVLEVGGPDSTVIVGVAGDVAAENCFDLDADGSVEPDWSEAHMVQCVWDEELPAGESLAVVVSIRIDDAVVTEGWADVDDTVLCCADPNIDNNQTTFTITSEGSAEFVADLAISATEAQGEVGEVVDVVITLSNLGPDNGRFPSFTVAAPSGTVAVAAGEDLPFAGCDAPSAEDPHNWTEATELACGWQGELEPGVEVDMTVSFRIDDAEVGDDGVATAVDFDPDPDLSNNTAAVTITVVDDANGGGSGGGELPVTGGQAGLIGAVGAGVLLAGGALYLLGRRRQTVLTSES